MPREVSRGHSTGGNVGKGRTGWWASDRETDIGADDIRMDEAASKCRCAGSMGYLGRRLWASPYRGGQP
jgi:hypothetical protein